jgi:hypothetical protein
MHWNCHLWVSMGNWIEVTIYADIYAWFIMFTLFHLPFMGWTFRGKPPRPCHRWFVNGNISDIQRNLSEHVYLESQELSIMAIWDSRFSRDTPWFFSGKLLVFHGYLVGKLLIFRNTLSFLVKEAWFAEQGNSVFQLGPGKDLDFLVSTIKCSTDLRLGSICSR